jgi:hypothetical protein
MLASSHIMWLCSAFTVQILGLPLLVGAMSRQSANHRWAKNALFPSSLIKYQITMAFVWHTPPGYMGSWEMSLYYIRRRKVPIITGSRPLSTPWRWRANEVAADYREYLYGVSRGLSQRTHHGPFMGDCGANGLSPNPLVKAGVLAGR